MKSQVTTPIPGRAANKFETSEMSTTLMWYPQNAVIGKFMGSKCAVCIELFIDIIGYGSLLVIVSQNYQSWCIIYQNKGAQSF